MYNSDNTNNTNVIYNICMVYVRKPAGESWPGPPLRRQRARLTLWCSVPCSWDLFIPDAYPIHIRCMLRCSDHVYVAGILARAPM